MTKKIFCSILTVSSLVLLSCFVLIMGVLYSYFGSLQKKQMKTELDLAVAAVEKAGVSWLAETDSGDCRFTYISRDGTVLYDSRSEAEGMESHADREEIREAVQKGTGESSRYSATLTEETLYYARRLPDGTILRASVSRMTVLSLVFGMVQPILIILTITLVLSALLASRMSKKVLRPLNELDLENPLENESYDELSPLLTRIEQQHRQIQYQKAELTRRKNEFYAVVENMEEGLVLLDSSGDILSMNPAAAQFFQAGEEVEGKSFLSIERNHEINKKLELAGRDGHSELTVAKNGREYQMNISRIESDGKNPGMVILVFDITEQVFAERNRREFTANVSHELKTPLHSIMGSAELLEHGLVKPEDTPEFVGRIRTEAARLLALIEDIIRLSQLDEQSELPVEDIDLHEIAKEEIEALKPAAGQRKVTLSLEGETTVFRGIRQLVHEIIYNLCDNGIKYNTEGGRVTVKTGKNGEGVFLSVADTGIGIPPEHQGKIFERFYRVDKSRSKMSGGTGLGLSIVKHAVQYMDGTVHLESTQGGGTEITVFFGH